MMVIWSAAALSALAPKVSVPPEMVVVPVKVFVPVRTTLPCEEKKPLRAPTLRLFGPVRFEETVSLAPPPPRT